MADIVRMDWSNPVCWWVAPYLFHRIWNFTEKYDPEGLPGETADMARVWFTTGDPRLGLWGVVDSDKGLVAHLFANPEPLSSDPKLWKFILVRQAEVNDGIDIRPECEEVFRQLEEWTKALGLKKVMMLTHRNTRAMARRWGFKEYKTLCVKELE